MWPTNMTKAVEPDILDVISVTTTTVIAGVTLLAGVFVVAIVAICWIRKYHSPGCMSLKDKKRKTHQSATPVSLSKGLLDADRYTTNPQYFAAAPELSLPSLSVPILSKENIQFHQIIGEGCFGKVYKGELSNEFGNVETVAIKVLKESASKETEEDFMREVGVMSSFQHSNILSLLGVTYKEPEKSPCMVFEFMPHGDLTEVLRSNSRHFWKSDATVPKLNKESLLSIAIQIASGMQYLAGQHFVHRDLACRNCLVGANLTVKIADFGMSRDVYTCDYYKIGGSRLLPVRWMSPESVTYGRFTLESDIWSYGVVLWEIYSLGKQPYYGHSNEEVVKLILQGIMLIPPEDCPASICEIMETCWKTEPRDRASFTEIYDRLLQISLSSGVSHQLAVDCEDYLKPHPPKKPHEYMQPLPD